MLHRYVYVRYRAPGPLTIPLKGCLARFGSMDGHGHIEEEAWVGMGSSRMMFLMSRLLSSRYKSNVLNLVASDTPMHFQNRYPERRDAYPHPPIAVRCTFPPSVQIPFRSYNRGGGSESELEL